MLKSPSRPLALSPPFLSGLGFMSRFVQRPPRLRPRSPAAHRMHVAHRDAAHSKVVFASVDGREDRVAAIKYNTSCTVRDAGPTSRAVLPGAQTERAYLANPRSTHRALELQDATERLERSHATLHGP